VSDAVSELIPFCAFPETDIGMLPAPQPVLEPCEGVHVLLRTVSYE
jgi:hypothetical protein